MIGEFVVLLLQLDETEDTPVMRARINTMSSPRRNVVPISIASSHVPPSPPQVSAGSLAQEGGMRREGGKKGGVEGGREGGREGGGGGREWMRRG